MEMAIGKGPKTISNVPKQGAKHALFRPNIKVNGDLKLTNACPKKLNSTNQRGKNKRDFLIFNQWETQ